jgi:hypothetical protein
MASKLHENVNTFLSSSIESQIWSSYCQTLLWPSTQLKIINYVICFICHWYHKGPKACKGGQFKNIATTYMGHLTNYGQNIKFFCSD